MSILISKFCLKTYNLQLNLNGDHLSKFVFACLLMFCYNIKTFLYIYYEINPKNLGVIFLSFDNELLIVYFRKKMNLAFTTPYMKVTGWIDYF